MSHYLPSQRFDTGSPLTEDRMRALAPSIFATEAHDSRSDRFAPIPTIEVLRGLKREGFEVVGVQQSRTRDDTRREFTKHLIRLRRFDAPEQYRVRDTIAEILLKNANDGSCCYDILAGLFRIVCLNGLVAQTGTIDNVKVRHSGDSESIQGKVIEGTYRVLDQAQAALAAPQDWSQINLVPDEQQAFAAAARVLRVPDESPIAADQFLRARRHEDQASDLWTTFNRVQENTIRGGLHGVGRDANMRRRRVTTRAVNGIDQTVKLNQALWTLAAEMAKLKQAA